MRFASLMPTVLGYFPVVQYFPIVGAACATTVDYASMNQSFQEMNSVKSSVIWQISE